MTDALGSLLNGMITAPRLCSHCDSKPAFIHVDEKTVACATCWTGIEQATTSSGFIIVTPSDRSMVQL